MKNKYQEEFDYTVPGGAGKVKPQLAPRIQEFTKHSPFCDLTTKIKWCRLDKRSR